MQYSVVVCINVMNVKFAVKQDDANRSGGKWIIRLKKGLASRCWENLILAMLGEQFMVGEEICGAVISVRNQVVRNKSSKHLLFSISTHRC